jgi:hypothetical protein
MRHHLSANTGRDGDTEHQDGPPPWLLHVCGCEHAKSKLEMWEPMKEEDARKEELQGMLVHRRVRLGEEAGVGRAETGRGGRHGPR